MWKARTYRRSPLHVMSTVIEIISKKIMLAGKLCKNLHTEFYENSVKSLIADTGSETDGQKGGRGLMMTHSL